MIGSLRSLTWRGEWFCYKFHPLTPVFHKSDARKRAPLRKGSWLRLRRLRGRGGRDTVAFIFPHSLSGWQITICSLKSARAGGEAAASPPSSPMVGSLRSLTWRGKWVYDGAPTNRGFSTVSLPLRGSWPSIARTERARTTACQAGT